MRFVCAACGTRPADIRLNSKARAGLRDRDSGDAGVNGFEDTGITAPKGHEERPGLDAMMKAVDAKEFDRVATWSLGGAPP